MDFAPDPEVVVSEQADADCLPIFDAQGQPTATVQRQFANGEAINFVLKRAGQPISACFTYRNYEPCVGDRRCGAIRSAAEWLCAAGCVQRTCHVSTAESHPTLSGTRGKPSLHPACRSVGLTRFVTMEHFPL